MVYGMFLMWFKFGKCDFMVNWNKDWVIVEFYFFVWWLG